MSSSESISRGAEEATQLSGPSQESSLSPKGHKYGLLLVILLAGVILRGATLSLRPVWDDEAWTYFAASGGWRHLLQVLAVDSHPPVFYLLEMLPIWLFGREEWALRLIPLLSGLALIVVAARIQRRLADRSTAVLAATLISLSPLLVYSSQEARSYSLLAVETLVGAWAFWQHAERPTWRSGILAVAALLLASFTHYFGTFLLLFGALAALLRNPKRWPAALAPVVIGAVGVSVLIPLILTQKRSYAGVTFQGGGYGEELGLLHSLVRSALVLGNGGYPEGLIRPLGHLFFAAILIGAAVAALRDRDLRAKLAFPGLLALVLVVCWQAGGRLHLWPIRDNYVAVIAPPMFLMLATAITAVKLSWVRVATACVLLGVMLTGDLELSRGGGRRNPDYRSAAAWVAKAQPDGVLLARSWGDLSCFQYYQQSPPPMAVFGLDPSRPGGITFEAKVVRARIQSPEEILTGSDRICLLGKETGQAGFSAFTTALEDAGFRKVDEHHPQGIHVLVWEQRSSDSAGRRWNIGRE